MKRSLTALSQITLIHLWAICIALSVLALTAGNWHNISRDWNRMFDPPSSSRTVWFENSTDGIKAIGIMFIGSFAN